jgi:hypothetical protein
MDSKIWLIMVAVALAMGSVQAADMAFYADATIEDGDVYDIVRVYDTPPDHTTVDMFGGSIEGLQTFDATTVNIYGGGLEQAIETYDLSLVNIYGGSGLVGLYMRDASTLNIYGGKVSLNYSAPWVLDSSELNIYGYDFDFDGFTLTGFLSDGSAFKYIELTYASSNMNLIEVGEPLLAEIAIKPKALNLRSKGKWLTCRIWLPEDCNVAEIDPETVLLERRVKADWAWFDEEQQVAMFRFSRSEVVEILEPGEVELTVTGHLVDGTYFEGTDTIKVIDKGRRKD